jgi:hypothetical protein
VEFNRASGAGRGTEKTIKYFCGKGCCEDIAGIDAEKIRMPLKGGLNQQMEMPI